MNEHALARLQLPRRAMALVLAGGRGSRLQQLTDVRAKPAVYFGGKFRIVDFAMSNCLNSGIRRMAVMTQYKSHSLLRHIQRGWGFLKSEMNEFVDLLPAQQRIDESSWYRGTADAVWQNLDIIRHNRPEYLLVLAADHIYKMDYARLLVDHVERGAPCTVACFEVPIAEARAFGVMKVDDQDRILEFAEKPEHPEPIPGRPDVALASMGIYLFDAEFLYDTLPRFVNGDDTHHDFGRDVIPALVAAGQAIAHPFTRSCVGEPGKGAYWRDVGTLDAYWEANIDLTATDPQLNLYDRDWPIWTYQEQLPPAKFVHNMGDRRGLAIESMVSGGCIVSGQLNRSLLFSSCRVHSFAKVDWSVLLPEVQVGRGARLTKCIVDRGCTIPDGMVIGEDPLADAERFNRTTRGVTLVTRDMLARLG
ncbi:MAG: glucose-1-phosphate adenylyltransferase [Burkholderiaceae bacterium]